MALTIGGGRKRKGELSAFQSRDSLPIRKKKKKGRERRVARICPGLHHHQGGASAEASTTYPRKKKKRKKKERRSQPSSDRSSRQERKKPDPVRKGERPDRPPKKKKKGREELGFSPARNSRGRDLGLSVEERGGEKGPTCGGLLAILGGQTFARKKKEKGGKKGPAAAYLPNDGKIRSLSPPTKKEEGRPRVLFTPPVSNISPNTDRSEKKGRGRKGQIPKDEVLLRI